MTREHAEREAESLSRTLGCEVTAADVLAADAEWDRVWAAEVEAAALDLARDEWVEETVAHAADPIDWTDVPF